MAHAELALELAAIPALSACDPASLARLAERFRFRSVSDGATILAQGSTNSALFVLRRGTVAVRVRRGGGRETLAEITAPSFLGELSFLTGRICSADVQAVGPVDVAEISSEALADLGPLRDGLLHALLQLVAARLHDTTSCAPMLHKARTVWLRPDDRFPASLAFATELAAGLKELSTGDILVVAGGLDAREEPDARAGRPFAIAAPPASDALGAERFAEWRTRFRYTVALWPHADGGPPPMHDVDMIGDLVAAGRPLVPIEGVRHFVAADAARASLDRLSGTRQLLFDADAAEDAFREGRPVPARFRRTARSLARAVVKCQVGLALGGGGACCWAHVGLLSILAEAGIPVDAVAGCSMGSLVGGLLCSGRSIDEITQIADWWRTRYWRMIELRFWRLHAVSAGGLERALRRYFGSLRLTNLEIPFWANAVDIETGEEIVLDRQPVPQAVRASMALPGSWPPLELDGQVLVDAAIMAPVPVGPVRAMGVDFVVAQNVMPSMHRGSIPRRNPRRFYEVLMRSLRIAGHEIGNNRAVGDADVMLAPRLEKYSLADFPHCHEIIRAGVEEAERFRPQITAAYRSLVEARA
jgi:NTE family protein